MNSVGAKAQNEKMRRNTTKTNDERNFQYTKFSVIDFYLPTEEIFRVHGQNRPVAKLPVVDFCF